MKLSGYSDTEQVKADFGPGDGNHIVIDFTQGSYGRAFCGDRSYSLPDPKQQLVRVQNIKATLEIHSHHGRQVPMGAVEVKSLKVTGDVQLPVARAQRFSLHHSSLHANDLTGPSSPIEGDDPMTIGEISLMDSRLRSQGEINFWNLGADDESESFVEAKFLEGVTAQGRLNVKVDRLAIGILEADEVLVRTPHGCRVGQIYCDRVLREAGNVLLREEPVRDKEIAEFMLSAFEMQSPAGPTMSEDVGMDL